jgi:MFS family permease
VSTITGLHINSQIYLPARALNGLIHSWQRARSVVSLENLLTIATAIFGVVVLATSTLGSFGLLSVLMSFGGAAWIVFMSLFNTLIQNLAPDWVRARVLAVYLFVFQGSVAGGSLIWGYAADRTNVHVALLVSSLGIAGCILLRFPLPLPTKSVDLSTWNHWGKPAQFRIPAYRMCRRLTPQKAQKRITLLAQASEPLSTAAGVFSGNDPDLRFESGVHRLQLTATMSGVRGQR